MKDSAEKHGMINNGIAFKLNSGRWRIIWMGDTSDVFFYINDNGSIVHLDRRKYVKNPLSDHDKFILDCRSGI